MFIVIQYNENWTKVFGVTWYFLIIVNFFKVRIIKEILIFIKTIKYKTWHSLKSLKNIVKVKNIPNYDSHHSSYSNASY